MDHSSIPISFTLPTITYMELHIWNYMYEINDVIGRWNFIENLEENNEIDAVPISL